VKGFNGDVNVSQYNEIALLRTSMAMLIHHTPVMSRQSTASRLAPEYHGNNRCRNSQTNHSTHNKHILYSISLDPGRDRKWDTNAYCIAHEGNGRESLTGNLEKSRQHLQY
jgi:hypothetical protein